MRRALVRLFKSGQFEYLWLSTLAICLALVLILPAERHLRLASWLGGFLGLVLENTYHLIKTAVPWGALGMLLGFAKWGQGARLIALFGLPLLLVSSAALGLGELRDWLVLPLGLSAGLWLGERSRQIDPAAKNEALVASGLAAAHGESGQDSEALGTHESHRPARLEQDQTDAADAGAQTSNWTARLVALLLAMAVAGSLWRFPCWNGFLSIACVAYAAIQLRYPDAWLLAVPIAVPLLDLAPWTGRFFWDEFDLLLSVTLAIALWTGRLKASSFSVPKLGGLLGLFLLVWGISLFIGLVPLQPLDANAFAAYWSHYNSLRLAKGLVWGLLVYGLFRSDKDQGTAFEKLAIGMAIGVLGLSLLALREEIMFAGSATTVDYRVTAGFSSMHTGGGHIEAYLAMALPFVWGLFFLLRNPIHRVLLGATFLLGTYALFFTVARGGVIALALALMILVWGTWKARGKRETHRTRSAVPLAMGLLTLIVMVAGLSGTFWRERLQQVGGDAGIRWHHWVEVLGLRNSGAMTSLFGMGLGSFPAVSLSNQLPDQAGAYRYASEPGGNTFLALNSAGTLYMAQRVQPRPAQTLTLELSVRAPVTNAGLEASLCEKSLFNSRRCQWMKVDFRPGIQEWQSRKLTFRSGEVGAGNLLTQRPVQFSLYNPNAGTVVDVDNVRLLDESGHNLLSNGDFSRGGDFWFFKAGNHLVWHAKNLWVHLLFEQGWLGVSLFTLIMLLALTRLTRAAARGELEATVLLASTLVWVIIGGVDSLVDAPRIALLVYGLLFIGATWGAAPRASNKRRRHRRWHAPHEDHVRASNPA